MKTRFFGATLVLCAAACFVSWGQDRTQESEKGQSQPTKAASTEKAVDKDAKAKAPQGAGGRPDQPEVRKSPATHLTAAEDAASERAIRAQMAALIGEYNAKNAEAFIERFLPNAEYELDTGEVFVGRPAIRAYFEQAFERFPDAQTHLEKSEIRLVSLHMAIEEGTYSIVRSVGDTESKTDYVAIWAFNKGRWLLASVRELPSGEDAAHQHLGSLGWLVGDWLDESPDALVKTSCRWSNDGNFLLQDFTVQIQGADVLSGTNRIGWDPLTHKVRAWLFDSEGGFGESFWNWDGERWVIRSSAIRADGVIVASLNYLIPLDNDGYRWEASHRMSGDEPLPDVSVLIVRQAPPPDSTVADGPKE